LARLMKFSTLAEMVSFDPIQWIWLLTHYMNWSSFITLLVIIFLLNYCKYTDIGTCTRLVEIGISKNSEISCYITCDRIEKSIKK
jgi:hypothetical protein